MMFPGPRKGGATGIQSWLYLASDTFIAPIAGVYRVALIGGGGSGGKDNGQGGCSGVYKDHLVTLTQGEEVPITIGTGGVAVDTEPDVPSGSGTATSFGAHLSGDGGVGGKPNVSGDARNTSTSGTASYGGGGYTGPENGGTNGQSPLMFPVADGTYHESVGRYVGTTKLAPGAGGVVLAGHGGAGGGGVVVNDDTAIRAFAPNNPTVTSTASGQGYGAGATGGPGEGSPRIGGNGRSGFVAIAGPIAI